MDRRLDVFICRLYCIYISANSPISVPSTIPCSSIMILLRSHTSCYQQLHFEFDEQNRNIEGEKAILFLMQKHVCALWTLSISPSRPKEITHVNGSKLYFMHGGTGVRGHGAINALLQLKYTMSRHATEWRTASKWEKAEKENVLKVTNKHRLLLLSLHCLNYIIFAHEFLGQSGISSDMYYSNAYNLVHSPESPRTSGTRGSNWQCQFYPSTIKSCKNRYVTQRTCLTASWLVTFR